MIYRGNEKKDDETENKAGKTRKAELALCCERRYINVYNIQYNMLLSSYLRLFVGLQDDIMHLITKQLSN